VEEIQPREEDLEVVEVPTGRLFDVGGLEESFGRVCSQLFLREDAKRRGTIAL
jgi:hypothetical protein